MCARLLFLFLPLTPVLRLSSVYAKEVIAVQSETGEDCEEQISLLFALPRSELPPKKKGRNEVRKLFRVRQLLMDPSFVLLCFVLHKVFISWSREVGVGEEG